NSMIIILPDEGNYTTFEDNVTPDKFKEIRLSMSTYMVNLTMPKFSCEWDKSLASTLKNLGMTDAFTNNADFSGIDGAYDLAIDDVFHKSFISVDEKGTEASAATTIVYYPPSIPEQRTMTINRPFLYFIVNDDTGTILFFGRLLEP
ncbi:MAG: hypothetical protein JXJ04_14450, partial [Spirochaetales bacterium]|nr:hypothetical protein [Spirochaetales bacterium]